MSSWFSSINFSYGSYRNNWCENVMEYVTKIVLIDLCGSVLLWANWSWLAYAICSQTLLCKLLATGDRCILKQENLAGGNVELVITDWTFSSPVCAALRAITIEMMNRRGKIPWGKQQVSDVNVCLFGRSLLILARCLNWKMFVLITLLQYSLNFADVWFHF